MIETTRLRNVEFFGWFPDGEGEIVAGLSREESLRGLLLILLIAGSEAEPKNLS
jgi:hypothetical protein